MSPQTNGTPSPFAQTGFFPIAPTPVPTPEAFRYGPDAARPALPWWANGWLTKGFALMAGAIVMASLVFVSSLRAEREAEDRGPSASAKPGIVSVRATNDPRNARNSKSTLRPRAGSTKSGVID